MTEGTPNRTTQPATNALATVSAIMSAIRIASNQCVKQSTHVSKYVKPFEGGNGPTNIQMDMVESSVRCGKGVEWSDSVSLYL